MTAKLDPVWWITGTLLKLLMSLVSSALVGVVVQGGEQLATKCVGQIPAFCPLPHSRSALIFLCWVISLCCNGRAQCCPTQVLQDSVRIIQKGFTLSAVAFADYVDLLAIPFASEFRKREHVPPEVPANICLCDKLQLLRGMIRN